MSTKLIKLFIQFMILSLKMQIDLSKAMDKVTDKSLRSQADELIYELDDYNDSIIE